MPSNLEYHGKPIRIADEMLNLTDMWKAAGSDKSKRPVEWLRSKSAAAFTEAVEVMVGKSHLFEIGSGRSGSTVSHWQIGLAYAKYLSPEFHIWCNTIVCAHIERRRLPQRSTAKAVPCVRFFLRTMEMTMANADRKIAERVPVTLRGANVLTEFRDALFDASNRAGQTPNEFCLAAAAEKLVRSGRHLDGLFETGDLSEMGL